MDGRVWFRKGCANRMHEGGRGLSTHAGQLDFLSGIELESEKVGDRSTQQRNNRAGVDLQRECMECAVRAFEVHLREGHPNVAEVPCGKTTPFMKAHR